MGRPATIREIVAAAVGDTNASRGGPAIGEGRAMHPSTHAALALLLLAAQGAHAQAPLPAGFVDAAAVVDGLVVDMRYFGISAPTTSWVKGSTATRVRVAYCRRRRPTRWRRSSAIWRRADL